MFFLAVSYYRLYLQGLAFLRFEDMRPSAAKKEYMTFEYPEGEPYGWSKVDVLKTLLPCWSKDAVVDVMGKVLSKKLSDERVVSKELWTMWRSLLRWRGISRARRL